MVKKSETFNIRFAFIEMVHNFMRYNAFKNRWHRMFGLFPFVILTRSSVFCLFILSFCAHRLTFGNEKQNEIHWFLS